MADSDQSSENVSVDSREESSQDTKLVFTEDEECLIIRMFNLIGERWSLIAGRIPGRTAEEIEKYWTSSRREIIRPGQTAIRPAVTRISTHPSATGSAPSVIRRKNASNILATVQKSM